MANNWLKVDQGTNQSEFEFSFTSPVLFHASKISDRYVADIFGAFESHHSRLDKVASS